MEFNYFDTLHRAQKAYTRMLEPICRRWELTRNELDVLLFLYNNPELNRAADIVSHRGMAKSHVSLSVSNLERRGLLFCCKDPSDRRTVHLELAGEAGEIARAGQEAQKAFFSRIHRGVTPEEFVLWRSVSQKISGNIQLMETE
jgi:MarR family transcriptional regulator for hemolysin